MSQAVATDHNQLPWTSFVALSGEEGRRWVADYRRCEALSHRSQESLALVRQRRPEEARKLLARAREEIDSLPMNDPSFRSVLDRWYYAALGFCLYSLDAVDEADRAMAVAHEAVAAAISCRRCLLPLAEHCFAFRLHRGQIARNARRWSEMEVHLSVVRAMMYGESPFCVLDDGTPVWVSTVKEFYASLTATTESERETLASVLDDGVRLPFLTMAVRDVYRIPGQVIQYL